MLTKLFKFLGARSDITLDGNTYMRRWRFLPDSWPGFRVHHILRSDDDRELHDHPFSFISIILKGGYWEHTIDGQKKWYGPGSIIVRSAEVMHRIELAQVFRTERYQRWPGGLIPAWTFVLRGPYRREWGFLTGKGWLHWKLFDELKKRA